MLSFSGVYRCSDKPLQPKTDHIPPTLIWRLGLVNTVGNADRAAYMNFLPSLWDSHTNARLLCLGGFELIIDTQYIRYVSRLFHIIRMMPKQR